jgi:acyl carrier protein
VEIWSDVLQVRPIGIHDNFFELGGHSLLATRVISRVNQDFEVQIPLRKLFEHPTVEGLALIIAETKVQDLDSEEIGRLLAELESAPAGGAPAES